MSLPARRPLAIAHRGDPYRIRENTLPSVLAAVAAGADAVEVDVRTSRDGVPLVVHDATLKRLWGHDRAVAGLDAAQVRRLTVGEVPTLREVLRATAGVPLLIDLPEAAAVRGTLREVRDCGATDRVAYCGGPAAMRAVRRQEATAEIALTWQRAAPPRPSLLADVRPRWLNYRFGLLSPGLVRQAHQAGHLVSTWTVDSGVTMRRLLAMEVDAITTNRIATLRRLLDRRTARS